MVQNDTLAFLNSLTIFGWKLDLHNIIKILDYLGNPQRDFEAIHIAGTNGKGSTSSMLESILRHGGHKTGLFTSPHLISPLERILVAGSPISFEAFDDYLAGSKEKMLELECTYFEALTAVAMKYFSDSAVEVAIVEVGLGGKFDATNIVNSILTIITEIALDHTQFLGETLVDIAGEKAGTVKTNVPCLCQRQTAEVRKVLRGVALSRDADYHNVEDLCTVLAVRLEEDGSNLTLRLAEKTLRDLWLGLPGLFQVRNLTTALSATLLLHRAGFPVSEDAIRRGVREARWPGRLQKIQEHPKIVVDVAHNPVAVECLMQELRQIYHFENLIVVVGLLADKDYVEIANTIANHADYVLIKTPESTRALTASVLKQAFERQEIRCVIVGDIRECISKIVSLTSENDLVCVTGSHYIVGEFLSFHKKP